MNKTIRKTLMALLLPAAALTARAQLTIDSCYAMARANYPLVARYGLIEKTRHFNLANAAKDVGICMNLAKECGFDMPGEANVQKVYEKAMAQGLGPDDWRSTIKIVRGR